MSIPPNKVKRMTMFHKQIQWCDFCLSRVGKKENAGYKLYISELDTYMYICDKCLKKARNTN